MSSREWTPCPGCGARLPPGDGPTHRYIGASPACWAIYSALLNAGEPPVAPTPALAQLVDAYAAQHPGAPSAQATQSVAVHLLALYGVLVKGVAVDRLVWLRTKALRARPGEKHGRFQWLTPPDFAGSLNVAAVAGAPTPPARAGLVERYVRQVWERWAPGHAPTIARWYAAFVEKE